MLSLPSYVVEIMDFNLVYLLDIIIILLQNLVQLCISHWDEIDK